MKLEDAIKRYEFWAEDDRIDEFIRRDHRKMADWLKELEVDRRVGEWIEMGQNEDGTHNVKCNQCDNVYKMRGHAKSIYTKYHYRFCPHCGADMRGGRDD